MGTVAVYINPEILIWAREQQGYDITYVMNKSGFSKLGMWDFRVASHIPDEELSPQARTEIRICESRRKKALELGDFLGESMELTLPEISLDDINGNRVKQIREKLGINQKEIGDFRTDKEALQYWITKTEKANILVFRSVTLNGSNPSFKEIRGISSYYNNYPWILLNSQEHPRGQLFTLGHELGHLLLHGNGICTLDEENSDVGHAEIEKYCNRFSASLLMPKQIVQDYISRNRLSFSGDANQYKSLDKIKKVFHVSREAAARRLESLGYVSRSFYLAVRKQQMEWLNSERNKASGGGNGALYFKRVMDWNGTKYTNLVLESLHQNKISLGEAAGALRTKVNHLEKIESEMYG